MNNDTPADAMQLKPCPWCGGEGYTHNDGDPRWPWTVGYVHRAQCPSENVQYLKLKAYAEKAEAIAAWNTRAPSLAAQDGLVEAAGELAFAEAEYRRKHDLCGRGHIDTGRAWDRMRRAGDKVRAALASIEVK